MSVLITRPRADSERIAELLHRDGIAAFIWPLTEIRFIDGAVPPEPAALAITSSNAVAGYSRLTRDRTATVYCVGNRTAETARMAGFEDVQSADGDFAALVGLIVKDRPLASTIRVERTSRQICPRLCCTTAFNAPNRSSMPHARQVRPRHRSLMR